MAVSLPPKVSALERALRVPEGSLADEDLAAAEDALRGATALALAEVSVARASAWRTDAPEVVELVVLKAARREFENPQGLAQETLGEHTIGNSETSGVYLTAREVAQIRRAATGRTGGFVGTVRTPSAYGPGDTLVPLGFNEKYPA